MASTTASLRLPAHRFPSIPLLPLATTAILIAVGLGVALQFPDGTPFEALVGVVILAVTVWMLLSERYELTLAVLMLYIGLADGYLKLRTGSSQITLVRDLLLYAIVFGALARAAVRREKLPLPPLRAWIVVWFVVVVVQVFNPDNGTLFHSIASTRQHIEWVPLFFLGYIVVRSKARLRSFLVLLVAIAAINGVVGLVQFNLTPEQLSAWGPGYASAIEGNENVSARTFSDSQGVKHPRPFALGGDFGFGGIIGLIAVPAALALLSLSRRPKIRITTAILAAWVVVAIATSDARVAVVGSVISVLAFAALTVTSRAGLRTVLALGLVVGVAYATVGVLTSNTSSGSFERYSSISSPGQAISTTINYRRGTLTEIPTYAVKYPLGAGIGSNGPASSLAGKGTSHGHLNAESEPTFMLIELGIPGLLVMLGFNLALFYLSITHIRRVADRELRILLTAVAAPLFALFATWVVGIATAATPSAPYLWFSAGVLAYWLLGDGWKSVVASNRARELEARTAHAL